MTRAAIFLSLVLLGCAAPSKAQVFVMPNQGGGEITLTDRPCVVDGKNYPTAKEAYTWSPSAPYQKACWTIIDSNVHVLYLRTGDRMVYPITSFRQK